MSMLLSSSMSLESHLFHTALHSLFFKLHGQSQGSEWGMLGGGKVGSKLDHSLLYVCLTDSAYMHLSTYYCQDLQYNYFIGSYQGPCKIGIVVPILEVGK